MIQDIQKGQTLLIKGPSRVNLIEGRVEVFGKVFTSQDGGSDNDLIIPSAHNYPLHAVEASKVNVYTSNDNNITLIEENTINSEWIKIKDVLISQIKKKDKATPLKIMVLGISSGKTTLIKYLANNFLRENLKGGYLDSDLGQQIIFLPTTINIGEIKDYIISSADIEKEDTVFIGSTFPKSNYKFIIAHASKDLIDSYSKNHASSDFILIDTDGWIKTEAGIIYKSFFIELVDPDILVIFHDDEVEELKDIEKAASKAKHRKIITIKEKNKYFYDKDKDERRFLRQSQFAKVLEDFRKISIPLNNIKFFKTDYDKETKKIVEQEVNIYDLINLPYHYVIISLLNENSDMINLGLLFVINVEKNYILLFSDLDYKEQKKIKKILLGSLRLSTKGNHQGYLYL